MVIKAKPKTVIMRRDNSIDPYLDGSGVKVTRGGIYMPYKNEKHDVKYFLGIVVASGCDDVSVGDKVISEIGYYVKFEHESKELFLVKEDRLMGIIL